MSIFIKDIEMPKERGSFTVTIKYNGLVFDTETGIQVAEAQEVSPHGRLIDADAAKEFLKPIDSLFCYEPEWTWGELYESNCAAIDKLPTIIPASEGKTE